MAKGLIACVGKKRTPGTVTLTEGVEILPELRWAITAVAEA